MKNFERKRIAVISSPRSGNSWIRSVIAGALDIQEMAVHNIADISGPLPEQLFLQIHWYREPSFQDWLTKNDFQVLCIARQPLDILLSVLHYIRYEPGTARWLEGNVAIPEGLKHVCPADPEFLDYALSFGAENLLSISYQWWHHPAAIKVRYEDCVRDPVGTIGSLINYFGGDNSNITQWLQKLSIEKMKETHNRHGWQGRPGLYKSLMPYFTARRIFLKYEHIFNGLGYHVGPYFLSRARAKKNWDLML